MKDRDPIVSQEVARIGKNSVWSARTIQVISAGISAGYGAVASYDYRRGTDSDQRFILAEAGMVVFAASVGIIYGRIARNQSAKTESVVKVIQLAEGRMEEDEEIT